MRKEDVLISSRVAEDDQALDFIRGNQTALSRHIQRLREIKRSAGSDPQLPPCADR